MAVYKVIQDIEAEDKLVGPLTLKGFIYALITIFCGFISYRIIIATSLGGFRWWLLLLFVPPMALFGVLASPLGREQPTEVWLLSHIRYFLKPRLRIWDQTGVVELVTVTAPKQAEGPRVKDLSQTEVKSRLKTLASTMDSRGWAVKNVTVNDSGLLSYLQDQAGSDRLVNIDNLIQPQPVVDIHAADDILDAQNNPKAQRVEQLLEAETSQRKQNLLDEISGQPPAKSATKLTANSQRLTTKMTPPAQTAKLKELAQSGNALSVASVAKLANEPAKIQQIGPGEVVISLH
ncbi:PrgI family protein [Candidatus Saccharibacteria bacterium]|nr:PrgI family protein [Candidatus Saccharibacteria bacterium]